MPTNTALPAELSAAGDLTTFLKSLDPKSTLLDVTNIASAAIVVEGMGQHGGMSGSMERIQLTFNKESTTTEGKHQPVAIICKSNRNTDQAREHAKAMQLPREALFLKHIRSLQVGLWEEEKSIAQKKEQTATSADETPLASLLHKHAPTLVKGLPTIYYSEGDMAKGTKLLLVEDLTIPKIINGHSVSGVQSGWLLGPHSILNRGIEDLGEKVRSKGWDVKDATVPAANSTDGDGAISVDVAELVRSSFVAAAELHGSFWMQGSMLIDLQKKDAATQEYLRGTKWYTSALKKDGPADASEESFAAKATYEAGKELFEASMKPAHHNWFAFKKRVADAIDDKGPSAFSMPHNVTILMDVCCPHADQFPNYDDFLSSLTSRPHTLVHGDFHPGNMVVYAADNEQKTSSAPYHIALVDWEVVGIGSGPQDIGQYMTSHFTKEQFDHYGMPSVTAYADALLKIIEGNKSTETSSDDLRRAILQEVVVGALGRWAWLLGLMGGMETIPLGAMQYFVDQVDMMMAWSMKHRSVFGIPEGEEELAKLVGMCRP